MNEFIQKYREKIINYWQQLNNSQKMKLSLIIVFLIGSIVVFTVLATKTKYQLTFVNLDKKNAATILNDLDNMGVPYQLSAGGSNISVPESQSDKVKISLAQDINPGNVNIYSKFWDNAKWGVTDQNFLFLKKGAIEEELRGLILKIQGIQDAAVILTLPEEKTFVTEEQRKATASVVVNLQPGMQLNANQIKSIYKLISGSVPNLPLDNITLSDQYGDPLVYTENNQGSTEFAYDQQYKIKKQFEQDLKQQLDSMLGNIMGSDSVSVTVFAKMNFDQQKTTEELVTPVVDGKGIARSVETIQESYTGTGASPGGVPGTGDTQVPGYQSSSDQNGNYQHIEERTNLDVNKITKEIVSSPYTLEDLSVTVAVDLPADDQKAANTKQAIQELIKPIVSAALSETDSNIVNQKIAVIAQKFAPKTSVFQNNNNINLLYLYGGIALSVLALAGFSFAVARRRRRDSFKEEDIVSEDMKTPEFDFNPSLTEEAVLLQEIQKMSMKKPSEFVKLLRTWISED